MYWSLRSRSLSTSARAWSLLSLRIAFDTSFLISVNSVSAAPSCIIFSFSSIFLFVSSVISNGRFVGCSLVRWSVAADRIQFAIPAWSNVVGGVAYNCSLYFICSSTVAFWNLWRTTWCLYCDLSLTATSAIKG